MQRCLQFVRRMSSDAKRLESLTFDNSVLKELPLDDSYEEGSRQVKGACYSLVKPSPVIDPKLVAVSVDALKLLDIDLESTNNVELCEYFSGNKILPGSETAAHCYCGHQFGHFSGQLGDGAAIYLGEVVNNKNQHYEIQLKGAGPTPYSRSSDGRKVLRSSIREFLCSEAMHHLGVPSTRAGTLVTSNTVVHRDMFYDGNSKEEKCTVLLRMAKTFLRFGSFEIFKSQDKTTGRYGPSVGQSELLETMLNYSIKHFYPHILQSYPGDSMQQYLQFYKEVCCRTAKMVSLWQCIGFVHGVLNTDNMSILGITIDYGPYGFLDRYDPNMIFNTTDQNGRYTFRKQPEICHWNLQKFAEALKDIVPLEKSLEILNEIYYDEFNKCFLEKMRKKLGLLNKQLPEDEQLVKDFLETLEDTHSDLTNSFRHLNVLRMPAVTEYKESKNKFVEKFLSLTATLEEVKNISKPTFEISQLENLKQMVEQNPSFLNLFGGLDGPIKRELENFEVYNKIKDMTECELSENNSKKLESWLVKYEERLKQDCEGVSDINAADQLRIKVMNENNPRFILRNYIAQNAIDQAEKGNFLEVQNVLRRLEKPYDEENLPPNSPLYGFENKLYDSLPPAWGNSLKLS